jgi:hypothetical protein
MYPGRRLETNPENTIAIKCAFRPGRHKGSYRGGEISEIKPFSLAKTGILYIIPGVNLN